MIGFRRIGALGVAMFLGLAPMAASCGGGSATADSGATGAAGATGGGTPVEQCKSLVSTLCTRDNQCADAGATPAELTACNNAYNVAFGCDRAAESLATCLSDVNALSCASLFPPTLGVAIPQVCNDTLDKIPLSAAQMKCANLALAACRRAARCEGVTAPTQQELDICQSDIYFGIDCPFSIDVSATFDQCVTELPNAPCSGAADGGAPPDGGSLPASCNDPITYVP